MKRFTVMLFILVLVAGAVFASGAPEAATLDFPDPEKTITIIVPQGAGGGTDQQCRVFAECLKKVTGANFIVEDVPGGSTGIGTNQVINSEPDGYTLLMYGTYVVCGTMTGYTEGFKQLDLIAGLSLEPFTVAVHKDSKWQTFEELIEDAKANPGKITLSNAGAVATTGIVCYGINGACDDAFNVVSFSSGAEQLSAMLGKHCDAAIFDQNSVVSNPDFRPLVFLGTEHSLVESLSSLPLLTEIYPDWVVPNGCFRGIAAPKGTPQAVKEWLADACEKAFNEPEYQAFLKKNGILSTFSKLEDFEKFNEDMVKTMTPIVQATGLAKGEFAL